MKGFTSSKVVQALKQAFITLQPLGSGRFGIDAISRSVYELNGGFIYTVVAIKNIDTKGAVTNILSPVNGIPVGVVLEAVNIGTVARKGDLLRFQSGNLDRAEIAVIDVIDNDNIIIGHPLPDSVVGDTFKALRYNVLTVDEDGTIAVTANQGPTQFVLDGVDTEVEKDNADPANDRPLPTEVLTKGVTEAHYTRDLTGSPLTIGAGWLTIRTLTQQLKRVQITNNGGSTLALRNSSTPANTIIIPPGGGFTIDLAGINGNDIQMSAVGADANNGNIYINFGG